MAELPKFGSQDGSPLIDYVKRKVWGNPANDIQFQVKLARVSHELGYTKNFEYMGKYLLTPDTTRFWNIFTVGNLNVGNWNLGYRMLNWVPFNRWVNAAKIMEDRGVFLDFYNNAGLQYNRTETWIMKCFNGPTLIAFAKNDVYPMPVDKPMYLHCYSPDTVIYMSEGFNDKKFAYIAKGITYYDFREWDQLKQDYAAEVAKGVGQVNVYHNGVLVPMSSINPIVGDMIEFTTDPTIFRKLTFNYNSLYNYYSERDSNRKFILFPWFTNKEKRYYYFDDCRFYVRNKRTNRGIYFHRNNQDAVRQLTHQDYGISATYVETVAARLIAEDKTNLSKFSDIEIVVEYAKTDWAIYLTGNTSRIAELYLLEDPTKILQAMTGANSTVPFWEAHNLERSPHNKLLGVEYLDISNENSFDALGYNGVSWALSQSPAWMPGITPGDPGYVEIYPTPEYANGKGYKIPPTFMISSTVYEYDTEGYLLRTVPVRRSERYTPNKDVGFCEYALGENTSYLDAVLTKSSLTLKSDYGFRVYRAPWAIGEDPEPVDEFWGHEWSISRDGLPFDNKTNTLVLLPDGEDIDEPLNPRPWDGGELAGPWEDITDTNLYTLDKTTGVLTWNFSMVNYVGMVVYDSKHLYNEVSVSHLDNSLMFSLTHLWEIGGVLLPIRPYQVDIWYGKKGEKGKSLIENVDYIFDFPTVYLIGKQLLDEGNDHFFRVRAVGLSKDGPHSRSELGFITNGVIGWNGRYNVRVNHPTKTICNGRLMLTQSVDWAETKGHGNNLNGFEGLPYEVKHIASLNKYVKPYETMSGIDDEVAKDEVISAYLGANVSYKGATPPQVPTQMVKYILFSPFMSQLYNELNLGFITTPTGVITDQDVYDLTANIQWLLKYDPVTLDMTPAYFEIHPTANIGYQPITPAQLTILTIANRLFLKDRLSIRGHFEVKPT